MFVDSHCHPYMLDLSDYGNDFDAWLSDTKASGVDALICVAVDMNTAKQSISIAEKYDNIFASVGSHPSEKAEDDLAIETIVALAKHPKVVAIGETGLDYYYNKDNLAVMRNRFRDHIRAAKLANKPLIIHTRDARKDTIEIMQAENADAVGGVMHCFTESMEMAEAAMALGFYISFSGIVTFKNAKELQAVATAVPLEKMLIETDAPYLAPVPYRGKQNESKYVRHVAEKIAELKQIDVETVAQVTAQNCRSLFGMV